MVDETAAHGIASLFPWQSQECNILLKAHVLSIKIIFLSGGCEETICSETEGGTNETGKRTGLKRGSKSLIDRHIGILQEKVPDNILKGR